jgi:hypothetical protein
MKFTLDNGKVVDFDTALDYKGGVTSAAWPKEEVAKPKKVTSVNIKDDVGVKEVRIQGGATSEAKGLM